MTRDQMLFAVMAASGLHIALERAREAKPDGYEQAHMIETARVRLESLAALMGYQIAPIAPAEVAA